MTVILNTHTELDQNARGTLSHALIELCRIVVGIAAIFFVFVSPYINDWLAKSFGASTNGLAAIGITAAVIFGIYEATDGYLWQHFVVQKQ